MPEQSNEASDNTKRSTYDWVSEFNNLSDYFLTPENITTPISEIFYPVFEGINDRKSIEIVRCKICHNQIFKSTYIQHLNKIHPEVSEKECEYLKFALLTDLTAENQIITIPDDSYNPNKNYRSSTETDDTPKGFTPSLYPEKKGNSENLEDKKEKPEISTQNTPQNINLLNEDDDNPSGIPNHDAVLEEIRQKWANPYKNLQKSVECTIFEEERLGSLRDISNLGSMSSKSKYLNHLKVSLKKLQNYSRYCEQFTLEDLSNDPILEQSLEIGASVFDYSRFSTNEKTRKIIPVPSEDVIKTVNDLHLEKFLNCDWYDQDLEESPAEIENAPIYESLEDSYIPPYPQACLHEDHIQIETGIFQQSSQIAIINEHIPEPEVMIIEEVPPVSENDSSPIMKGKNKKSIKSPISQAIDDIKYNSPLSNKPPPEKSRRGRKKISDNPFNYEEIISETQPKSSFLANGIHIATISSVQDPQRCKSRPVEVYQNSPRKTQQNNTNLSLVQNRNWNSNMDRNLNNNTPGTNNNPQYDTSSQNSDTRTTISAKTLPAAINNTAFIQNNLAQASVYNNITTGNEIIQYNSDNSLLSQQSNSSNIPSNNMLRNSQFNGNMVQINNNTNIQVANSNMSRTPQNQSICYQMMPQNSNSFNSRSLGTNLPVIVNTASKCNQNMNRNIVGINTNQFMNSISNNQPIMINAVQQNTNQCIQQNNSQNLQQYQNQNIQMAQIVNLQQNMNPALQSNVNFNVQTIPAQNQQQNVVQNMVQNMQMQHNIMVQSNINQNAQIQNAQYQNSQIQSQQIQNTHIQNAQIQNQQIQNSHIQNAQIQNPQQNQQNIQLISGIPLKQNIQLQSNMPQNMIANLNQYGTANAYYMPVVVGNTNNSVQYSDLAPQNNTVMMNRQGILNVQRIQNFMSDNELNNSNQRQNNFNMNLQNQRFEQPIRIAVQNTGDQRQWVARDQNLRNQPTVIPVQNMNMVQMGQTNRISNQGQSIQLIQTPQIVRIVNQQQQFNQNGNYSLSVHPAQNNQIQGSFIIVPQNSQTQNYPAQQAVIQQLPGNVQQQNFNANRLVLHPNSNTRS